MKRLFLQHLVIALTAAVCVMSNGYCMCAAPKMPGQPTADHCGQKSEGNAEHPCHEGTQHHPSACKCLSMIADQSNSQVSADQITPAFAPLHFFLSPNLHDAPLDIFAASLTSGDLTVPFSSPTLLQLHCALTL